MAVRKPKVIVTRKLPDPVETRMRELFDTELNLTDQPMGQDELLDALQRAEVLVPTITDRIDSRLLSRAGPSLKLIANFGAGVDNIDVATANATIDEIASTMRDALLNWPARVAGVIAAELGVEPHLLQTILQQHINELLT
jgi:phosphoglycerate dehydrogenase-like enzyme